MTFWRVLRSRSPRETDDKLSIDTEFEKYIQYWFWVLILFDKRVLRWLSYCLFFVKVSESTPRYCGMWKCLTLLSSLVLFCYIFIICLFLVSVGGFLGSGRLYSCILLYNKLLFGSLSGFNFNTFGSVVHIWYSWNFVCMYNKIIFL